MDETQAINLITKHFPIAIQAYIQTTQEKKFLNVWEKLGELENGYSKQATSDQQEEQYTVQRSRPPQRTTNSFNNRFGQTQRSQLNNQPPTTRQMNNLSQKGADMTSNVVTHGQQAQINNNFKKTIKQITLTEEINDDEEIEGDDTEDTDQKNYEQGTVESD